MSWRLKIILRVWMPWLIGYAVIVAVGLYFAWQRHAHELADAQQDRVRESSVKLGGLHASAIRQSETLAVVFSSAHFDQNARLKALYEFLNANSDYVGVYEVSLQSARASNASSAYWVRSASHQLELAPWGHPEQRNTLDALRAACARDAVPTQGYISAPYSNACGEYVVAHAWPQFDESGRFCGAIGIEISTSVFEYALGPWRRSVDEVWFLIAPDRSLIFDTAAEATQVLSQSSLAVQGQLGPVTDVLLKEVDSSASTANQTLAGRHYWVARAKVSPSEEILVLCKPGVSITDIFFKLYGLWMLAIAIVPLFAMCASSWLIRPYFERLKGVIRFSQRLADQDWNVLAHRPQIDEINAPLLKSMQRIAQDLRTALDQFNALATSVQNIHIQFKEWIGKQERLVLNEEGAAEQLSALGARLVNELEGILDALRELDQGAKQSAHHARQCQEPLGALKKTLSVVKENSQHVGAKIASIHDKIGNISDVVSVLQKIADFTHIVSLNAALQAQKAGPEAQGFAAVAGEVRRLADQSTVATQDIVTMVEELQLSVARTLTDAQQNSGLCTHGVMQADELIRKVQEVLATAISHSPRLEGVCGRVHELVQIASTGSSKSIGLLEFSRQSSQLMVVSDSLRAQLENALRGKNLPEPALDA